MEQVLGWLEKTLEHGVTPGAAKPWQDPGTKTWYLLVSVDKTLMADVMDAIATVKGVDLIRRNIAVAVECNIRGKYRFYPIGHQRHLAERVASAGARALCLGVAGAGEDVRVFGHTLDGRGPRSAS